MKLTQEQVWARLGKLFMENEILKAELSRRQAEEAKKDAKPPKQA